MKAEIYTGVKRMGIGRDMEDRNIDCIVHKNDKLFNDTRIELSRVLGIPQSLSNHFTQAVCTCSAVNNVKDNSPVNLEMYCIYEAPTDVFLLDELQCDDEDGNVLSDRALEFVSEAIAKMRQEQNKSATRFVCILKMALTEEYPLLEEYDANLTMSSQQYLKSNDINFPEAQDFNDQVEEGNSNETVHKKSDGKLVNDSTSSKCGSDNKSEDSVLNDNKETSTVDEKNHCHILYDVESPRPASDCDNSSHKDSSMLNDRRKKELFNSIDTKASGGNSSKETENDTWRSTSDTILAAKSCYDKDSDDLCKEVCSSSNCVEGKAGKHLRTKQREDVVEPACIVYSTDTDNIGSIKLSMAIGEDNIPTMRLESELYACKEKEEAIFRNTITNGGGSGKSDDISRKRKWKKKELKTFSVILRFPDAYSCSMWNIRKGTRSICMKFRPCFVDAVFGWGDKKISGGLKHNELLLKIRCHPEAFNSVAMEMKWKAMSFKRVRYYFNEPAADYIDVLLDSPLFQECKRDDYENKVFGKRKSRTKRQNFVPEKKLLYKCYNCHAESENNVSDEAMRVKTYSPSRFLECHHHPGYVQRDKKWSCCGRDSRDIIDSDVRDQNDRNGCSWGEHIWRRYLPKTETKLGHRDRQDLTRHYKKKLYYTG